MNNFISATDARNRFFEILNLVASKGYEFVVEKDGKPAAKFVPLNMGKTLAEIKIIIAGFKKTFGKTAGRKYWSILETPAWNKKEKKYLKSLINL